MSQGGAIVKEMSQKVIIGKVEALKRPEWPERPEWLEVHTCLDLT